MFFFVLKPIGKLQKKLLDLKFFSKEGILCISREILIIPNVIIFSSGYLVPRFSIYLDRDWSQLSIFNNDEVLLTY